MSTTTTTTTTSAPADPMEALRVRWTEAGLPIETFNAYQGRGFDADDLLILLEGKISKAMADKAAARVKGIEQREAAAHPAISKALVAALEMLTEAERSAVEAGKPFGAYCFTYGPSAEAGAPWAVTVSPVEERATSSGERRGPGPRVALLPGAVGTGKYGGWTVKARLDERGERARIVSIFRLGDGGKVDTIDPAQVLDDESKPVAEDSPSAMARYFIGAVRRRNNLDKPGSHVQGKSDIANLNPKAGTFGPQELGFVHRKGETTTIATPEGTMIPVEERDAYIAKQAARAAAEAEEQAKRAAPSPTADNDALLVSGEGKGKGKAKGRPAPASK